MRRSERAFLNVMFWSRWLLAPLLVGLLLTLILLICRFFADLYALVPQLTKLTWHDLIVGVLNLIDIVLTANLVLIVIFSGYENFIGKISPEDQPGWPEGLAEIDFMALKQRLMGSIVVIAAVDALAWYLDLERNADPTKLGWAIGFPLMFVAAMLMFAIADRLGRSSKND
jgi:uncharacterized protein (TIGR00645 family)